MEVTNEKIERLRETLKILQDDTLNIKKDLIDEMFAEAKQQFEAKGWPTPGEKVTLTVRTYKDVTETARVYFERFVLGWAGTGVKPVFIKLRKDGEVSKRGDQYQLFGREIVSIEPLEPDQK